MRDYDYRCLESINDDLILLEWDIAVDRDNLEAFIAHAKDSPDRVIVAPYRLYMPTTRDVNFRKPVWCHRVYVDGETRLRHVTMDDTEAHLFGMGMIYIPRVVKDAFLASWPGHCSDASFSGWHNRNVRPAARITWDVRPAHLHYLIDRM